MNASWVDKTSYLFSDLQLYLCLGELLEWLDTSFFLCQKNVDCWVFETWVAEISKINNVTPKVNKSKTTVVTFHK